MGLKAGLSQSEEVKLVKHRLVCLAIMYPIDSKTMVGDGEEGVYSKNRFLETFRIQSSHSHLRRYVIFDRSGGKGRVIFHPALARDVLNSPSSGECEDSGNLMQQPHVEETNAKLQSFRQTMAAAFASLQGVRNSRQVPVLTPNGDVKHAEMEGCATEASFTLTKTAKEDSKQATSGSMHENTENLDALLSWEEEDDDDEVRSTGHSPNEMSEEGTDEIEGEEHSSKRRKLECSYVEGSKNQESIKKREEDDDKERNSLYQKVSSAKLKIQKTVKTLRNMLPGGAYMHPALVLDQTILYLEALREQVHQLESVRFQIP